MFHTSPEIIFFYGHLSIYDYAVQYCRDAIVLDAGSGNGYGSAHLAKNGARHVWGIEISEKAVAFSRHHFQKPNLTYQEMNLENIHGFPSKYFDFIYSSNVLEHVPNVAKFLRQAWNLLKPTGTMLLAVPPITNERLEYLNLINPYHVNIWTPRQWAYALGLFFEKITPVLHGVEKLGADFKPEHSTRASTLTEKGFVFVPGTIEDMYQTFTLTSIFVAEKPRLENQVPAADSPLLSVDESFTRPQGYIDPAVRQRLKKHFDMPQPSFISSANAVFVKRRPKEIVKRAFAFVRRNLYRSKE